MEQDFFITFREINSASLIDNPNLAVLILEDIMSEKPGVVCANKGFANMTGYTLQELGVELDGIIWRLLREADRDYLKHTYKTKYDRNTGYQCHYQVIKKGGDTVYVLDNGYFFENERGEACAQMILTDVTSMQVSRMEVCACKNRLELGIKSANSCVFEVDLCRNMFTYIENAAGLLGYSDEKVLEDMRTYGALECDRFWDLVAGYFFHPDDQGVAQESFEHVMDGYPAVCELRVRVRSHRFVWCRLNVTPVLENDFPVRMIGIATNINQIKVCSDKYKRKAARDLATGLYNKKHAELLVKEILNGMPGNIHAMILVDIDNLKCLNDTYGHDAGDEVIRDISQQMKRVFRKNDVVGRFGGDEFLIFMKDVPGFGTIESRMKEVLENYGNYKVTKSIGVSIFPRDGEDFESLFKSADLALYESKKKKNAYTLFGEKTQGILK